MPLPRIRSPELGVLVIALVDASAEWRRKDESAFPRHFRLRIGNHPDGRIDELLGRPWLGKVTRDDLEWMPDSADR